MDSLTAYCISLDKAWHQVTIRLATEFAAMLESGMSLPQFHLLRLLADGGLTVSEASQRTGVTPAAITLLADRLVRAGLLSRERDRHDRRIVRLNLSAAGQDRLGKLETQRQAIVRRYLERLSPQEREQLLLIVERLAEDDPESAPASDTSAAEPEATA